MRWSRAATLTSVRLVRRPGVSDVPFAWPTGTQTMMGRLVLGAGVLGAATAGGALFAFSSFVMRGLGALPPAQGVAAMQAINRAAPNPWFMVPLFGTTVIGLGIGIRAGADLDAPGAPLELAGAVTYVIGSLITVAFHVPRNEQLGAMDPDSTQAVQVWAEYLPGWTAMNHVRVVACLASAVMWMVALDQRG